MKKFFGLCILVLLLVAASGCTQPAKTTTATPVPTEVVTTAAPTSEATMPATIETTLPPTVVATTAEVTTAVTTAVATETATVVATTTAPRAVMTPSTKVTVIYIRNNTFVPQELTVLPGTGITWINEDRVAHNVKTTPTTTVKFNSGDLMPGASFGYTFGETVGTYGFMDATTNATGRIIIKKGESFVGAPSQATVVPTVTTT